MLKVLWHEIFLFLNMHPINVFIKVAFLFFQVWSGNLAQIPNFQRKWSLNWSMDFLVALITFSIDFLVALHAKHDFSCCSKYHSMSFLIALNTNSIGFLVALTTHSMNIFVALR